MGKFNIQLYYFLEGRYPADRNFAFSGWHWLSLTAVDFEQAIREYHPDKWFVYVAWCATKGLKP